RITTLRSALAANPARASSSSAQHAGLSRFCCSGSFRVSCTTPSPGDVVTTFDMFPSPVMLEPRRTQALGKGLQVLDGPLLTKPGGELLHRKTRLLFERLPCQLLQISLGFRQGTW